jgi:hypothetical protein
VIGDENSLFHHKTYFSLAQTPLDPPPLPLQ